MVEFTSDELALEDHTVPSTSLHEFLLEGIENLHHKSVASIQVGIARSIRALEIELEEARKVRTLGANKEETRIIKRMRILADSKERAINRMEQLRELLLVKLEEWEQRNDFGEGV